MNKYLLKKRKLYMFFLIFKLKLKTKQINQFIIRIAHFIFRFFFLLIELVLVTIDYPETETETGNC